MHRFHESQFSRAGGVLITNLSTLGLKAFSTWGIDLEREGGGTTKFAYMYTTWKPGRENVPDGEREGDDAMHWEYRSPEGQWLRISNQ